MSATTTPPIRIGVIGLGMCAAMVIPQIEALDEFELAAGADINPDVRKRFATLHPSAAVYDSADALCADDTIEAVWVATPNQFHHAHATLAMERGKHVVCEKPMATSLADAERMVEASARRGVTLLAGHTLGFSPPVIAMRRIIQAGALGRVRYLTTTAYTDWMLAPRTSEEVDMSLGGGVVFRQAPHQIDTVRVLGGLIESVRATFGGWAPERPNAPGFYSAFLTLEDGAVATITYNGYGYFQTAELVPWGHDRGLVTRGDPSQRAAIRHGLRDGTRDEEALKDAYRVGGSERGFAGHARAVSERQRWIPGHLGILLATCERGDLRQSEYGLYVYDDDGARDVPIQEGAYVPGHEDLMELYRAVRQGRPASHDGVWGLATLEVILAMIESGRTGTEVRLRRQTRLSEGYGGSRD